jgi:Septum formation
MTAPVTTSTGSIPEPDGEPPRAEEPVRRGPGALAIAALIMGVLLVAGIATGAVLLTHGRTEVAYQLPAVFELQAGECFNSGPNDQGLSVQPCSSPHDAEVFAIFPLPDQAYPGLTGAQSEAQAGCQARISDYMDPVLAQTAMDQEYIYPDPIAWQAGERTVICDVRSAAGLTTGTVQRTAPPPAASRLRD